MAKAERLQPGLKARRAKRKIAAMPRRTIKTVASQKPICRTAWKPGGQVGQQDAKQIESRNRDAREEKDSHQDSGNCECDCGLPKEEAGFLSPEHDVQGRDRCLCAFRQAV
uniref:hypothetical protein n=1 Tax=Altererythrobacter segetis TaxID=1104773 RepID=UPI0014091FD7|nr:hypothetical protein [Altererythrobacter segetis]